ncbi:uncharacterized protein LOC113556886 [Rhopalosiphum maidis]|uniref:uncharacterized protein LOC113556886 n=1 Tax=Rhopalosiphum maidis TaxID=43146 RepID=UPI000EFF6AAC|nr:uncharacterized protein LOC113556886 [Rhopalosiphum maidis]XP_026817912.1 uncharacterized protein LOC113556886 [Rhopalosiphum maidis]XP_026817919.1 uncharacterized protein LOC113556886 [Rhopalosiphum maidis]
MCVPSTERVDHKCSSDSTYKKVMKKYKTIWILSTVAALLVISAALQNYTVSQYVRAILKLTVMQLIDLNNFKNLLHDSCLVHKKIPERELTESDCYSCESIDQVDVVYKPEDVLESYADLNWPVAFQSNVKTNLTVEDIALVFLIGDLLPCDYESNLKIDPLRAIEMKYGWFMHWRNCGDIQGKIMRALYRPDSFLSISSETWTIMSFKYKTFHYKQINMYYDSRVAVSQISGTFNYRLVPKNPCTEICYHLDGRLETYHTLVFDNFIWDFQYLPLNNSTNSIAIIYYID